MTVGKAVARGPKAKSLLLLQGVGYSGQESVRQVVLSCQQEDGEVWTHRLEACADRELLVDRERGADDGKVISVGRGAPDSVVNFRHGIGTVARVGEHIRASA